MLFKVKVERSMFLKKETYTVYGIRSEDEKGNKVTQFLIYDEGKWKWQDAFQFVPLDE